MPRKLYPRENNPLQPFKINLDGCQSRPGPFGVQKSLLPLRESNPDSSAIQSVAWSQYPRVKQTTGSMIRLCLMNNECVCPYTWILHMSNASRQFAMKLNRHATRGKTAPVHTKKAHRANGGTATRILYLGPKWT